MGEGVFWPLSVGTVRLGFEHDNAPNTDNDWSRWITIGYLALNNTFSHHSCQINPRSDKQKLKYANKYTCKMKAGTEGSRYEFDNESLNAKTNLPVACGSCTAVSADWLQVLTWESLNSATTQVSQTEKNTYDLHPSTTEAEQSLGLYRKNP